MLENYTPALQRDNAFDEVISRIAFDDTPPTPTMTVFDIVGVDKASLFMALYNSADSHGYGDTMTLERAKQVTEGYMDFCCWIDGELVFTTWDGRDLYVDLSGDEVDITEYDNYNGEGTAFKSIKTLLAAIEGGHIAGAIGA